MQAKERKQLRKKLDKEMWHYRLAAKEEMPTGELLRAVRQALRVTFKEIEEKTGIARSTLFDLEMSERKGSITLRSLSRAAEGMGCKVVYGLVPLNGKTLEELAEERMWKAVVGGGDQGQGIGSGE